MRGVGFGVGVDADVDAGVARCGDSVSGKVNPSHSAVYDKLSNRVTRVASGSRRKRIGRIWTWDDSWILLWLLSFGCVFSYTPAFLLFFLISFNSFLFSHTISNQCCTQ